MKNVGIVIALCCWLANSAMAATLSAAEVLPKLEQGITLPENTVELL